jgi:molybdate transport system substrate-binding protein
VRVAAAVVLLALLPGCARDAAPPARVAVAASFAATADELVRAFGEAGGGEVQLVIGSTGGLFAQIVAGAPFDAFLAADTDRPDRLVAAGLADPRSRFVYALGRLALWSPRRDLAGGDPAAVLRAGGFDRLAVADPAIAPHGAAARSFLERAGLLEELAPRLVVGQSVGQAHQLTASGNAELGLVALAQVLGGPGSHLVVPAAQHPPLAQAAVALGDHPGAHAFLAFLRRDPAARALVTARGYRLPAEAILHAGPR